MTKPTNSQGSPPTVTIRDVARAAGYSTTVVSHALNGRARVSAATRERIRRVAEELGYRPNIFARNLVTQRSQLIGMVVPGIITSFYPEIITPLREYLEQRGYGLIVMTTEDARRGEDRALDFLVQRKVDGLIVAPSQGRKQAERLDEIAEAGTPVVMIDRYLPSERCHAVVTDNVQGGELGARHLLELGHRRMGVVRARFTCSSTRDRLIGYRRALRAGGVAYDKALNIAPSYNIGRDAYLDIGEMAQALLALPAAPTALVVFHDALAVSVLSAVMNLGRRVPEDLSLVGYDDLAVVKHLPVPLTTVAQNKAEIGRLAADLLMREISGEHLEQQIVRVPPQLVVRQSTAAPRP